MHRVLRSLAHPQQPSVRSVPPVAGAHASPPPPPTPPPTGGAQERPRSPGFQATPRPAAPITSVAPRSLGSAVGGAVSPSVPVPSQLPVPFQRTPAGIRTGPDSERRLQGKVFWHSPLSSNGLRAAGTPPPAQPEPPHPPPAPGSRRRPLTHTFPHPPQGCSAATGGAFRHLPAIDPRASTVAVATVRRLPARPPLRSGFRRQKAWRGGSAPAPPAWDPLSGQRCFPPPTW